MLSSCGMNGWVWIGALLRKSYKHGWSFRGDEATTSDIRTLLTRAHVSLSVTSAQRVHAKQNTVPPPSRHRRLRDGVSLGQLDSPRPCPSREEKYEYAYPSRKTWSCTHWKDSVLYCRTSHLFLNEAIDVVVLIVAVISEDEAVGGLDDSACRVTENLMAATWALQTDFVRVPPTSRVYEMRGYKSTVVLFSSTLQSDAIHRSWPSLPADCACCNHG
jgi:hypothetical protein